MGMPVLPSIRGQILGHCESWKLEVVVITKSSVYTLQMNGGLWTSTSIYAANIPPFVFFSFFQFPGPVHDDYNP